MLDSGQFLAYHGITMQTSTPQVRLNLAGATIPSAHWKWDTRSPLPDYDIVIVEEGEATYHCERESWSVSAGSCMLFRRGVRYWATQDSAHPVAMRFIHFDYLDTNGQPTQVAEDALAPLHFKPREFGFIHSLASRCQQSYMENQCTAQQPLLWLKALIMELQAQASFTRWNGHEQVQAARLETLCAEIAHDIGNAWRLPDIAARLGCSTEHAGRLFRKYQGMSPGDLVINTRIEAAKSLLASSSLSISQIADRLGYGDVYAFSRQFKLKASISPRDYRQQLTQSPL